MLDELKARFQIFRGDVIRSVQLCRVHLTSPIRLIVGPSRGIISGPGMRLECEALRGHIKRDKLVEWELVGALDERKWLGFWDVL